jgi:DinB family
MVHLSTVERYLRSPSFAEEEPMTDDFVSLYDFNRWANARMLEACRKLTSEQYAAEPVPGWGSVRSTVYHIAIVTDGWLRTLANDPDQSFPSEADVSTVDDAARILDRAYQTLNGLLPTFSPELLATPRTMSRRGEPRSCRPGWCCGTSSTIPPTTAARSRPSSNDSGFSRRKLTCSTGRWNRFRRRRDFGIDRGASADHESHPLRLGVLA